MYTIKDLRTMNAGRKEYNAMVKEIREIFDLIDQILIGVKEAPTNWSLETVERIRYFFQTYEHTEEIKGSKELLTYLKARIMVSGSEVPLTRLPIEAIEPIWESLGRLITEVESHYQLNRRISLLTYRGEEAGRQVILDEE